jgi:hypothetical protein
LSITFSVSFNIMNWKAILIGLITYPILWTIWIILTPQYEHQSANTYVVILSIFNTLMPLISGFIAAQISSIKGIQHGFVVGVILTALSLIGWYILDILSVDLLFNLAAIAILATVGGALSQGLNYFLAKK